MAHHSDGGLIICVGRRSEAALAEVYRRHGGAMHALAAQICGAELGEDVVREVLLALWRDPDGFDASRSSLRGLLLAQAHTRAVEVVRNDAAMRAGISATVVRGDRVDTGALAGHVGERAWSALSALPEHERSAIILAYFCGYSCAELAELVGQPQRTVKGWTRAGLVGLSTQAGRPIAPPRLDAVSSDALPGHQAPARPRRAQAGGP